MPSLSDDFGKVYLESKHVPGFLADIAFTEFFEEGRIIIRITEDSNSRVVLCGSAQESNSTYN